MEDSDIYQLFKREIFDLGINITEEQMDLFKKYGNILQEYNNHTNLTAITKTKDIYIKHFLDSAFVIKKLDKNYCYNLLDVGSGAGFPGVPIKILLPSIKLKLIDSSEKKCKFLNYLSKELNIKYDVLRGRAEDFGKKEEFREKFDVVVSRAVSQLNILCEYCMPFVKTGGIFMAMKGPDAENEIFMAKRCISELGGMIEEIQKSELVEKNGERNLVVIRKLKNTPNKYPRKTPNIIKKPL